MAYNPDMHHRRTIRLKDYDYALGGAYFITICAWRRECLFGEIVNGEMSLNEMGWIVAKEWERTPEIRAGVELDVYSLMPNHFHAIICLHNPVGAHRCAPESGCDPDNISGDVRQCSPTYTQVHRAHISAPLRRKPGSIGSIVAGFKSVTTKQINILRNNPGCPVWQRNYYERVIRNEGELASAREYIVNNPIKWDEDKENPVNLPATL